MSVVLKLSAVKSQVVQFSTEKENKKAAAWGSPEKQDEVSVSLYEIRAML